MSTHHSTIRIRGARQNNLKNLDLDIETGQLTVVTGVSGSGKSSLVFDTLYAEGQRRYVETFSPYARQFLDRQDRPQVDEISGVPPAIAIDQTNPVRTSRSTVGTMTEINDHLKLIFARLSYLYCHGCGKTIKQDSSHSIIEAVLSRAAAAGDPRLVITFPLAVPPKFTDTEIEQLLAAQGYTRIQAREGEMLYVVQDRLRLGGAERCRVSDAIETALNRGKGQLAIYVLDDEKQVSDIWRYASALYCPDCDLHYHPLPPAAFSFNSPLGACEACRGFGRVIGVDYGLVIPDIHKTLKEGAVKPFQTESFKECQQELEMMAQRDNIRLDVPWHQLSENEQQWVINGSPDFKKWTTPIKAWYGVQRFFDWLESRAYKMHVRVLLSRYRAYTPCTVCGGARLKPDALDFRLGSKTDADAVLAPEKRFLPTHVRYGRDVLESLPGLSIYDIMLSPVNRLRDFFDQVTLPAPLDEAAELVLGELRARLRYLCEVGLGYLTLDRQSRTLSGGEVQRINLTTALGTSLVNTLFVLDEPSIGLHPRDIDRINGVMQRLKQQGNTLLVVEHDPQIMFTADRLLDMGPGPGKLGGQIQFSGPPSALKQATGSLTADYLLGSKQVMTDWIPQPVDETTPRLVLRGAAAHNLKHIDVSLPLNRLVGISGVSGSGKSTLVQDVLYPALSRALGKSNDSGGQYDGLSGEDVLNDVVLVDQSAIGRTTRSNPASYIGAFDPIRKLFAALDESRERGYTTGTFSFNSGDGRCPVCQGSGFEHVEMQFLSDVYLRCPECDGRRYRAEVLETTLQELSIADVLDLTVSEAIAFFNGEAFAKNRSAQEAVRRLTALADVGLDYLTLGQPVPTLSGGEAQRLKLAGHLADAAVAKPAGKKATARADKGHTLFIFDEPTTGLHFEDIAKLLNAFKRLQAAGHSLLVIEHNLDVLSACDWLIDLGPEGGDEGGDIIFTGSPQNIVHCAASYTGRALATYRQDLQALLDAPTVFQVAEASAIYRPQAISIQHAREHNLKNLSVDIPLNGFTVITGPSGSGKSTLAFDIVFNEGQRRYLESLNAYARTMVQPAARPDVDAIHGIPPTVAIEQRVSRGGRKSTVATLTEIYHFLRLLWMKLGTQYCPDCHVPIAPQSEDAIAAQLISQHKGHSIQLLAPLVVNRKGVYTDLAKWADGKGYSQLRVDGKWLPVKPFPRIDRYKEHTIELPVAEIAVSPRNESVLRDTLHQALHHGQGVVHVLVDKQLSVLSTQRACPSCHRSFPELDPRLFSFNSRHGWCEACQGTGVLVKGYREDERQSQELADQALDAWLDKKYEGEDSICPSCNGERLNPVARAVEFRELSISQLTAKAVRDSADFFRQLTLNDREQAIGQDLISEIVSRLQFLSDVGLGYLSLDRSAPTLSGGEAQRIKLAAQLGSTLQGVCYVLDEPTIGLHPRDNQRLLATLERLEAKGNTLLVVEHDEDTIRRAHQVIDIGPGAGKLGGELVAQGTADELAHNPQSITGRCLAHPLSHPVQPRRAISKDFPMLIVDGATLHNLKQINARIPLGRLSVVTGVSGSGKSSLARDVIYQNLHALVAAQRDNRNISLHGCAAITGWQDIARVLEVDQTPIGKTPRSCPATYVGFWDNIRKLFADTQEARLRGWNASRFSFNTPGGRCPVCDGQGMVRVEMSFLPDVKLPCDACGGSRFDQETGQVLWREKSIGDVLAMDVDEAVDFFSAHPSIHHALSLLQAVGLGYLTLGQASPTLSGGEAQRIKLVTELAKVRNDHKGRSSPHTFYVLDEPTVGLHMADVEKLIRVLHRLVDAGNTVLLIEHNLDLIAEADWIIDLGPDGGDEGGNIVVQGTPDTVCKKKNSPTGEVLKTFLSERKQPKERM